MTNLKLSKVLGGGYCLSAAHTIFVDEEGEEVGGIYDEILISNGGVISIATDMLHGEYTADAKSVG